MERHDWKDDEFGGIAWHRCLACDTWVPMSSPMGTWEAVRDSECVAAKDEVVPGVLRCTCEPSKPRPDFKNLNPSCPHHGTTKKSPDAACEVPAGYTSPELPDELSFDTGGMSKEMRAFVYAAEYRINTLIDYLRAKEAEGAREGNAEPIPDVPREFTIPKGYAEDVASINTICRAFNQVVDVVAALKRRMEGTK